MTTYQGQCHCGAVRFSVETELDGMGDCNCSRCKRLGWVLQAAPADKFTLLSGSEALKTYRFNTHKIQHLFCTECGIESFARGLDGKGDETVMINVNCLVDAPDVDRATIKHWDGRNW